MRSWKEEREITYLIVHSPSSHRFGPLYHLYGASKRLHRRESYYALFSHQSRNSGLSSHQCDFIHLVDRFPCLGIYREIGGQMEIYADRCLLST